MLTSRVRCVPRMITQMLTRTPWPLLVTLQPSHQHHYSDCDHAGCGANIHNVNLVFMCPGSCTIDTNQVFIHEVSFKLSGYYQQMSNILSQNGKNYSFRHLRLTTWAASSLNRCSHFWVATRRAWFNGMSWCSGHTGWNRLSRHFFPEWWSLIFEVEIILFLDFDYFKFLFLAQKYTKYINFISELSQDHSIIDLEDSYEVRYFISSSERDFISLPDLNLLLLLMQIRI